jgi:hypothetical protein
VLCYTTPIGKIAGISHLHNENMDDLTIEITDEKDSVAYIPDYDPERSMSYRPADFVRDTVVFTHVFVNGALLPACLDIHQFFQAIQQSGRYPLFVCGTRCFDCCGYYVDVVCAPAHWTMKNRYYAEHHRAGVPDFEEVEYHIPWPQVKSAARQILDTMLRLREQNPRARLISGELHNNIAPHLEQYQLCPLLS